MGVPFHTAQGGCWNESDDVPPSTICAAPNHVSGCLGCVSSVTRVQWQSAYRGICLKSRDHPSVIPYIYSWCWPASALSAAAAGNLEHSHKAETCLGERGCRRAGARVIQVGWGKERCPVLCRCLLCGPSLQLWPSMLQLFCSSLRKNQETLLVCSQWDKAPCLVISGKCVCLCVCRLERVMFRPLRRNI